MGPRGPSPSPPAAVVSCLMERRTITGSLQKLFLVRWVGEAQSDSWHAIDAFIALPSSTTDDARAAFRSGLGTTDVDTPDALQGVVRTASARNPGPLVPEQVYIA